MTVGRFLVTAWGVFLVLMSGAFQLWILYSLFVSDEPSPFSWWWGVVLFGGWSLVLIAGVNRIRGRRMTVFGTARPDPPPDDWSG